MKNTGKNVSPLWERLLSTSLIPLAIVLASNFYSNAIKERETGTHYVELALNILREKPSEANKELRQWATKIIDHFSPVALTEKATHELQIKELGLDRLQMNGTSLFVESPDQKGQGIILNPDNPHTFIVPTPQK